MSAGTIPVLVRRLKQKDAEWRKVRVDLNKQVSLPLPSDGCLLSADW